jgi:tRNA threonylcarbamoyladenosine biosynthesis protein TsaB
MAHTAIPRFPILVIDTASTDTHVGVGSTAGSWSWNASPEESGTALFRGVNSCLRKRQVALGSIRTVIFCEGPGSMLGIRTAAMAIRTWATIGVLTDAPVLAYSSLALAAKGIASEPDFERTAVAIDARRKSWYCLNSHQSPESSREIRRIPVDESATIASVVFLPKGFPIWNPRPVGWRDCAYEPKWLESQEVRDAVVHPVDRPEALLIDPPVYQRWTPTISRPVTLLSGEKEGNR